MSFQLLIRALKGGSGSGNFGHSGRPGKIGGSASGGGILSDANFREYLANNYPHNPKLVSKLEKLEPISNGNYVGDKPAHACQTNSKNCTYGANELYVGYVAVEQPDGKYNLFHHWFNVIDGKVVERTDLDLEPKEDWSANYHYMGIKVPDKLAKTGSYAKIDNWFDSQVK